MNKATYTAISAAIEHAHAHQEAVWRETPHTVGKWLVIVEAELDKAKQAWVTQPGDREALCALMRVIGVAVVCVEQHGVVGRHVPKEDA